MEGWRAGIAMFALLTAVISVGMLIWQSTETVYPTVIYICFWVILEMMAQSANRR